MRILSWSVIAVFISTLFWSQLLIDTTITYCVLLSCFLLILPRLRFLAVIPISAVYFTLYAHLTLTGSLPISVFASNLPFVNKVSLQYFVDGQDHDVIVQVNSLINQKNKGYFTAKLIELDDNQLNYSPLLEMRWYKPTLMVQSGELHRFKVRFKPVYGRANPGGFDRQKWRFSEHIAYQATIKKHLNIVSDKLSLRAAFYKKVQKLTSDLDNQGAILALSFADKTLMSLAQKEHLKKLAISHLFAISGLHIGLLFSFVYFLMHLFVRYCFPKSYLGWFSWRFVNLAALMGAFFYAYLAGFSLPTQRAIFMLLFAVLVLSMKRRCALADLLSLTLFVILIWDPLAVLSVSLWLSFSAVVIILIILWRFPSIRLHSQEKESASWFLTIKGYLKFLFFIQLFLTLLMMPLQLLNFSAFNWLSVLINFIAVPLFSLLIIPLVLLASLFSLLVPSFALFLLSCADKLITVFFTLFANRETAYYIYSLNYGQFISLLVGLIVVFFVAYFHINNNRRVSVFFVVIALFLIGTSIKQKEIKESQSWFVEAIDVGQGLAVLVRSQGQTLLYDSGARYPSGYTMAAIEIVPYLQSLGISQLDYFVVSHSDIDHAGGFDVIIENFKPKQVILGEELKYSKQKKSNSRLCRAGQKWTLGALSISVLSPFLQGKNDNNNSCVLQIRDPYNSLLLTGDIEKKQERIIVKKYGHKLASDLLFAPHHGSKHSSSISFIKMVAPQWVIFSAGFMNRWNFPAEEVKLRYKNQSVKMENSGLNGFIRFKMEKGQINMQTYREDLAPYWYHHIL